MEQQELAIAQMFDILWSRVITNYTLGRSLDIKHLDLTGNSFEAASDAFLVSLNKAVDQISTGNEVFTDVYDQLLELASEVVFLLVLLKELVPQEQEVEEATE